MNETSKITNITNKSTVSSLISPNRKPGHKKANSVFSISDPSTLPLKGKTPKVTQEGSNQ